MSDCEKKIKMLPVKKLSVARIEDDGERWDTIEGIKWPSRIEKVTSLITKNTSNAVAEYNQLLHRREQKLPDWILRDNTGGRLPELWLRLSWILPTRLSCRSAMFLLIGSSIFRRIIFSLSKSSLICWIRRLLSEACISWDLFRSSQSWWNYSYFVCIRSFVLIFLMLPIISLLSVLTIDLMNFVYSEEHCREMLWICETVLCGCVGCTTMFRRDIS